MSGRWYQNADDRRCSGSNQIAIHLPDRDSKVECQMCKRMVGLRNPRTLQIAAHNVAKKEGVS